MLKIGGVRLHDCDYRRDVHRVPSIVWSRLKTFSTRQLGAYAEKPYSGMCAFTLGLCRSMRKHTTINIPYTVENVGRNNWKQMKMRK